jgi:serine/threonine-protein kinase
VPRVKIVSTVHSGQSIGTPGFPEEIRGYLQARLRLLTGTVAAITAVLGIGFIAEASSDRSLLSAIVHFATSFPNAILFAIILVSGGFFLLLLRKRLSSRALNIVDGLFLQALVVPCLILFAKLHFFSFSGFPVVVPFLVLFILTRAVLVPSTALRTAVLSLPAVLGVLGIQLSQGASFAFPGETYSPGHFVDMVVQNQVLLLGATAVAAIASRVNLGLRRSSYDARHLGQYTIGELIGEGAMGEVYLATHAMLKRPAAIKLLRPEVAGEEALRRFEREVRQTSRLTHPNTVSIFDYGRSADGVFYYAMEYLVGANLRQIVEKTGPMPPSRVIHSLVATCAALTEAHDKGLVHRDIKAGNIMLCERGGVQDVVKLLDFGLVKDVTRDAAVDRQLMGTPETMAPETILGQVVGPSADIYALGAVGYYLLTGNPVFEAESLDELLQSHESRQPDPLSRHAPEVPADLEPIVLCCLEKDPRNRPVSTDALRRELLTCRDAGKWLPEDAAAWWETIDWVRPSPDAVPDVAATVEKTVVVASARTK